MSITDNTAKWKVLNALDAGSATKVVNTLPNVDDAESNTIYLVPSDSVLDDEGNIEDVVAGLIEDKVDINIPSNIAWHNTFPRCKYLGDHITDAQNEAIKNRTYNGLFIGDYWTINGINYRIVAIDYYHNCGDTNFDKGNIVVVPDTCLYNAQMNTTNTTSGGYANSAMRTTNLDSAKSTINTAFGSHVASHRVLMTNATDSNGPSGWAWMDSSGVELMNETQVYGSRICGSALKGYDCGTQFLQFPLFAVAPQFINIRRDYWLQDISSAWVSGNFADVSAYGGAVLSLASHSLGVRPAITLSYTD